MATQVKQSRVYVGFLIRKHRDWTSQVTGEDAGTEMTGREVTRPK